MAEWSDDSSECQEELEEMEIASLLHEFMMWQEIYAVEAFLKKRKKDNNNNETQEEGFGRVLDLTRSNAGAWNPRDLFPRIAHEPDNSQINPNKKKKG